jgi:uncharacterized cupin superfamily protein
MPRIDLAALPVIAGTGYPPPLDRDVSGRSRQAVGVGLADFGANLVTLQPGAWSSQRHWHTAEDELVMMIAGEAWLIEDARETALHPGDFASFPKGVANAHRLENRSAAPCTFLAVGTDRPDDDTCHYPDVAMTWCKATGYVRG